MFYDPGMADQLCDYLKDFVGLTKKSSSGCLSIGKAAS
ncbi:MAG: hypothetical protein ACI8TF_001548 [Paracoccaceae bacterium]|jgi:hypothetical protein